MRNMSKVSTSGRVTGVFLDAQVGIGDFVDELSPTAEESTLIIGAVGSVAVVALVVVAAKYAHKKLWLESSESSIGWPERFEEREAEAIAREKEEGAARRIALRSWWEARKEPGMTIPYVLGGMVGSFLRRPDSISDDESL